MKLRALVRWLRRSLLALFSALLVIGIAYWIHFLVSGPELKPWHTVTLTEEFTARSYADGKVTNLAQYRELEQRLFEELQRKVYAHVPTTDRVPYNRYVAGSRSDPGVWEQNWNRTFILDPPGAPVGGVLLLHGLTDSPYSMRSIAVALSSQGMKVVGLRLPGHGTAPAAMNRVEVEDLTAATRLAMRDLRAQLGAQKPLYMVGYSNGAALSVNYALDALDDKAQPAPAGLVLISPAIGISRLAAIGRIKVGLAELPGFGRVAWQSIEPEIDPYKYQSFNLHGAGVTQRLTSSITRRIAKLAAQGPVRGVPPILAFLSTVDSTVQAPAVVDSLLGRLAPEGHELVLFDINRLSIVQPLLVRDPAPLTGTILKQRQRPFALTLITNLDPDTRRVVERHTPARSTVSTEHLLEFEWPSNVFSLSHVALPFPPDDPLYGYAAEATTQHVQLGRLEVRGENGVLNIPMWLLTRQRSSPFHAYMIDRILRFVRTTPPPAAETGS